MQVSAHRSGKAGVYALKLSKVTYRSDSIGHSRTKMKISQNQTIINLQRHHRDQASLLRTGAPTTSNGKPTTTQKESAKSYPTCAEAEMSKVMQAPGPSEAYLPISHTLLWRKSELSRANSPQTARAQLSIY